VSEPEIFRVDHARIDYAGASAFQEELLGALGDGSGRLVVDFARVETISSVGLRALVVASKKSRAANGRLAVANLQPIVREVFRISRFDAILALYDSVDAAVAALRAD
jgi:anti-anti-sigma factor